MGEPAEKQVPKSSGLGGVLRGGFVVGVSEIGYLAINYAIGLVIARSFGATGLGVFTLAQSVLRLIAFLVALGLDRGAVRYTAIYSSGDRGKLGGFLAFSSLTVATIGIAAGTALLFLAPTLADALFKEPALVVPLTILAVAVPLAATQFITLGVLQGFKDVWFRVIGRTLQPLVLLTALLVLPPEPVVPYVGIGLSFGITLIAALALLRRHLRPLLRSGVSLVLEVRSWLAYSIPLAFDRALIFGNEWIDAFFLGYYSISADVGVYAAALKIANLVLISQIALNSLFVPQAAQLCHDARLGELSALLKGTTRWICLLCWPIGGFVFATAGPLLSLFGDGFTETSSILVVLLLGKLFYATVGTMSHVLAMAGYSKLELFNSLTVIVINLGLDVMLIPSMGVYGAAVAGASALLLSGLLRIVEGKVLLAIQPFSAGVLKPVVAASMATTIVVLVRTWFLDALPSLIQIGLAALLLAAVYVPVVTVLGLAPEDKKLLRTAWRRIKAPVKTKAEA